MSGCPPREQLAALANESLAVGDRVTVVDHVATCADCRHTLERLNPTLDTSAHVAALPRSGSTLAETQIAPLGTSGNAASMTVPPLELPGFQILAELGRGGMGVVYKARQVSLDRVVALKVIRSAALAGAAQLARFKIEAESLAQLQHPHIVQVFDIGWHDDLPYLSMEFVAGETLADASQRRNLPPTESARLVEKLARAMFSAHQRGVVHRDLKPSNVLLAMDGEPKITDFGLAKRTTSDSHLTASDAVMGTPSYMPPEQARGQIADIGPPSDIYALGTILYELLTGRPPFRGNTPLETLQQVILREPPPPRSLNPKVPRDLETICLKCLHKQINQRYATAADLADDLRRFQAGEPIVARRIGLAGRGWRWCRRNPALATALTMVVAAVAIGATGFAWQSRQTEQQRQRASEQFKRVVAESEEKLQLIQDLMERVPEEERAQNERLQSALAAYEGWLAEEPADVFAREGYTDALFRVAEIRRRIGQFDRAIEGYQQAHDHFQRLADAAPQQLSYRYRLADTLNWLGECHRECGQQDQAIAAYSEALRLQQGLTEQAPSNLDYRGDAARSLYNRALALRDLNRWQEAELDLRQSIQMLNDCLAQQATEPAFRQGLARSQINLGILLRAQGHAADSHREYLSAIDTLQGLQREYPRAADYRIELATALMNRANLLFADRQQKELGMEDPLIEAEQVFESSVALLQHLVREFPNVPRYRKELANNLNGLGAVQEQSGNSAEAETSWNQSLTELQGLVDRSSRVAEYHVLLAQTSYNLAYLHRRDTDPAQQIGLLRGAIDHQQQATELSPQNVLYTESLGTYQRRLAGVHLRAGDHAGAALCAEQLAAHNDEAGRNLLAAAQILSQCFGLAKPSDVAEAYRKQVAKHLVECRRKGIAFKSEDFPDIELPPATNDTEL